MSSRVSHYCDLFRPETADHCSPLVCYFFQGYDFELVRHFSLQYERTRSGSLVSYTHRGLTGYRMAMNLT